MGVDARGFPGGLLRLDPAFVYVKPPSSWPLPWAECLTPAPNNRQYVCVWVCLSFCLCVHVHSVSEVCLTLCNPMDCSLPGFSVHGIFQARIPEWAAISYSRGPFRPWDKTCMSHTSCIGRQILSPLCHLKSPLFIFKLTLIIPLKHKKDKSSLDPMFP